MELSPEEDDDLPGVDGCPCLRTKPCSKFCTCVDPMRSGGCRNCAKYGSVEQQTLAAMYISDAVAAADRRSRIIRSRHGRAMPMVLTAAALALLAALVAFLVVRVSVAHAEPKPGLWQEQVTSADGVTVRKLRDTTGGDFSVCYVASRIEGAGATRPAIAVSISCLPEARKP